MGTKYDTLTLVQLREIAKSQGVKSTSIMRKAQLVQILCDLEEKLKSENADKKESGEKESIRKSQTAVENAENTVRHTADENAENTVRHTADETAENTVRHTANHTENHTENNTANHTANHTNASAAEHIVSTKESVGEKTPDHQDSAEAQRTGGSYSSTYRNRDMQQTGGSYNNTYRNRDAQQTGSGYSNNYRNRDDQRMTGSGYSNNYRSRDDQRTTGSCNNNYRNRDDQRTTGSYNNNYRNRDDQRSGGSYNNTNNSTYRSREAQRTGSSYSNNYRNRDDQRRSSEEYERQEERPAQNYSNEQNDRSHQENQYAQGVMQDGSAHDERYLQEQRQRSLEELDSGKMASGILEVMPDGYGFIRCANYLPGDNDVYVSPAQIRRFNLKTGDIIEGNMKIKSPTEKFSALLFLQKVNGFLPDEAAKRVSFEDMTPIFPNERIRLENPQATVPMRIVDLVSPIGKGQRGMIVSPPKTGKTTLLKQIAKSISYNYPDMNMIILLIDERPEEVTDIKEYIEGDNVEVIYSTFDELPEHHKRVSEMVLERAKRLVEHRKDVVILLDSITRLARAYNLTVPPSGRTLSGGLDPAALHMPKKFFGAARNMRGGGSLTVLATALVETGSKMDDVVFEEFKGTGNMELVLDRKLSEKRIFPAIDIPKSGTRREELLLDRDEMEAMYHMRKALNGMKSDEALEHILDMFTRTRNNKDFIANIKRTKLF